MDGEEIIVLVALIALVVVPALAITARLALRPIVEAIIRLREGLVGAPAPPSLEPRLERMEREIERLRTFVREELEGRRFDRELGAGPTGEPEVGRLEGRTGDPREQGG